jgi:putative flavoprotein involved in K+ transport
VERTNTIIVGAGQSGLALSYYLTQKKIPHLILERGKVGERWRSERWDNFHLITPNKITYLPGFPYSGDNPDGFDSRDQVIYTFEEYAKSFKAPVLEKTNVLDVTKKDNDFLIHTSNGDFECSNLVIATGSFHKPNLPSLSHQLPSTIKQIHSSEYKNAKDLPEGAVLVVGGGVSGVQVAHDLNQNGRKTYLSLSRIRITPRHYRGKDFMEWAQILGVLDRKTEETSEDVKNTIPSLLFGFPESVNLRKLAQQGIQMLGRLTDIQNGIALFAQDLVENILKGEAANAGFKTAVDKYINEHQLDIPIDEDSDPDLPIPEGLPELNLKEEDITSIIWATGFEYDWSYLKLDAFDQNNEPIHMKGVSNIQGLYFIGLRWLSKYKSFLLCGVAEDAKYLANQIISNNVNK